MVDRRAIGSLLTVCGFAAGWFVHARVASHAADATMAPPVVALDEGSGATAAREAAFDDIYRTAKWGSNADGAGTSGSGSRLKTTAIYRMFLEQFLKDSNIHSVVDAGCGDWEFSQAIDWTGIDYKGYDIVPSVIHSDTEKYGKPNIQFFTADIVEADLPPADLLVSKHVLQHLPNADVQKFLTRQLHKYRYVLLTDGVLRESFSSTNPDIKPGQYRPLDLTRPPFNLVGAKILTYSDGILMHQVLLITNRT